MKYEFHAKTSIQLVENFTCYTIGYNGHTFENFISILHENRITHLVDIRYYPYTWQQEYNKEYLKEKLNKHGIFYVHCSGVGNIKEMIYNEYIETKQFYNYFLQLVDYIKSITKFDGNVVLMCAEKNPKECHRRYLASYLEEQIGIKVIHLIDTGQTNLFNFK